MIGRTLAQYEITAQLGVGGMGEVYRARDSRLGREVAIKVLPEQLAQDPERLARFRREARVLAALNHPNIAGLHGFEEAEGTRFLVMELVEGEELAQRMRRGAMSTEGAVEIAAQMATGLQAAHERGIVHRDLKPQNVKITPDGDVKILDFGLAFNEGGEGETSSDSPTITAALTQAGTLLGTAGYMSPEQATGRPVDARTDVWAFGVILFEMLSGKSAFVGETTGDTLAAVIRGEPDWDALPEDLPRDLHRLLRRCLRKKAKERWASISDARLELVELDEHVDGVPSSAVSPSSHSVWRPSLAWLLPLAIGILAGVLFTRGASPPPVAPEVVRGTIDLPDGTQLAGWSSPTVELSPDGRKLAVVLRSDEGQHLYVRSLDQTDAIRVPDSEGAEGPFFSPDGRWIAFGAGSISGLSDEPGRLKKYSLDTGQTTTICGVGDYFGGTWREDDTIFFVDIQPNGLFRVSAEGGEPERLDPNAKAGMFWPRVLPGGRRALVVVPMGEALGRLHLVNLENGSLSDLGVDGMFARWTTGGHLLVVDIESRLWAYRFDAERAELGKGRVQILEDLSLTGNEAAAFAVSDQGTFVYSLGPVDGTRQDLAELFWVDAAGERTPLPLEPDFFTGVAVSPDGNRLALCRRGRELWVADLQRGTKLQLPRGEVVQAFRAHWSPDSRSILFTGVAGSNYAGLNIFRQSADGVDVPVSIENQSGEFFPSTFVPGTTTLLYWGYEAADRIDLGIYAVDLTDSTTRRKVLDGPSSESRPSISPDGRWMAYELRDETLPSLLLRSWPELDVIIPVGKGRDPEWSADGRHLHFIRHGESGETWWKVSATPTDDGRIAVGLPEKVAALGDVEGWEFDPSAERYLVLEGVEGAGEVRSLHLVLDWFTELQSVLPTED